MKNWNISGRYRAVAVRQIAHRIERYQTRYADVRLHLDRANVQAYDLDVDLLQQRM